MSIPDYQSLMLPVLVASADGGSGGMFVHSANFVQRRQKTPNSEISVFGTEKTAETLRMAKLNLAVHGLSGDIREANTYYEDPHQSCDKRGGRFDFVMANPPFNVSGARMTRAFHSACLPRITAITSGFRYSTRR